MEEFEINQTESGRVRFDYDLQCWAIDGIIQRCGHPAFLPCACIGRRYPGRSLSEVRAALLSEVRS